MMRLKPIALTALLVFALVAGAAMPAAATHEDGDEAFFDGLVEDSDSTARMVIEKTAGVMSEVSKRVAGFQTDETNASDDLQAFADVYNQHNASIEDHANERLPADENHTSIRLTCTDTEDREATMYLIGDYNSTSDAYENTRIVNESTFQDTGREVDGYVDGDWYICSNGADELEYYVDNYAEPNEDLTKTYYADMMRKYASSVESDLWGEA